MNKINKKSRINQIKAITLMIPLTFILASCANSNKAPIVEGDLVINDPFEGYNRAMFAFNQQADKIVINPFIKGYRTVAPKPVRAGIRNFLRNIRTPVTLTNQLLQGDLNGAKNALVRGAINTTVGVGGIFDVAGHEGIEYEGEDFGQTLAVWGVGHGPYMVVPLLGPSSLRDYSGYFADSMIDPLRMYLFNVDHDGIYYGKLGADYLDIRESVYDALQDIEASSLDPYAATRSIYYQRRQALTYDLGETGASAPAIPNYDENPGE